MNTFKLAIIGSRLYPDESQVKGYVNLLRPKERFVIVTGGAQGVDSWAEDAAKALEIPVRLILPSDPEFNHAAPEIRPLLRNEAIVKECDGLVAFWNMQLSKDGKGSGTVHAMRLAIVEKKLIKVMTPWGVLRPEGRS